MDLNQLLSHHQQAQIVGRWGITEEQRAWSRECAAFYAKEIGRTRSALGRDNPFTWPKGDGGFTPHG